MPEYTENYGLTLPLKTENYDLDHMTDSMEIIDTELKRVDDKAQEVEQDLAEHKLDYVEEVDRLDGRIEAIITTPITTRNLAYGAVTPNETTFAELGKNKFTGTYIYGTLQGGATLTLTSNEGICAIEKLKPNTTYTISRYERD